MMMMVLLARIWESKVREEKKENADDKDETKQTGNRQLHFGFQLLSRIVMIDMKSTRFCVTYISLIHIVTDSREHFKYKRITDERKGIIK